MRGMFKNIWLPLLPAKAIDKHRPLSIKAPHRKSFTRGYVMNKHILLLIMIVISFQLFAQAEDWFLASQGGGTSNDNGKAIVTDDNGNSFVTGTFSGTASFGGVNLTSSGGVDIFIAKMDASGIWLWAKRAGGAGTDQGTGISLDETGNIIVTGYFTGTASFGTTNLNSSGYSDIFVCKLDESGNWLWAKRAGGTSDDVSYGIATDTGGNSYISGYFYGTATFGGSSLTSFGAYDAYIAKIDASGNWQWIRKAGGAGDEVSYGIAIDANANCYITGNFNESASFGGTYLYSSGANDDFVAKLDANGNWLWAKKAGGSGSDYAYGISASMNGSVFITGYFYNNATYGSTVLSSNGSADMFIAMLDTDGTWLWAKNGGGTNADYGQEVVADSFGNCFVAGYFNGIASFGETTLSSNGNADIYYAKLSSAGEWLDAGSGGSPASDVAYAISTNSGGFCYLAGYFNGTASFGDFSLVSNGGTDICVLKGCQPILEAQFTASVTSGLEPLEVQFTDLSMPGAGTIISWLWDFGNGDGSTLQNPLYTYQIPGTYAVTLTVTNSEDSTASLTRTDYITVVPRFPEIEVSVSGSIDFGSVYLGSSSAIYPIWVKNVGTADLLLLSAEFMNLNSPFSIVGNPVPAVISEGDSLSILLVFSPVFAGSVSDSLFIGSNAVNCQAYPISLRGTGEYVPPKAPEHVNIMASGYDVTITWDAVTETIFGSPYTPDYYLVFYNGSDNPEGEFYFHGATADLSYTHYLVGLHTQNMFYRVRAYKSYGRSTDSFIIGEIPLGMPETEVMQLLK